MTSKSPYRFTRVTAVAAVVVAALAPTARAQDRLIVGGSAPTAEAGAIGHFGDHLGARPDWALGPFADGGRFAVETVGGFGLAPVVRRVPSGAPVTMPEGWLVATDPIRPRVFVLRGTIASLELIAVHLDTGAATTLTSAPAYQHTPDLGPPLSVLPEVQLAHEADQLFVRRGAAGGAPELAVIRGDTGALVRTLPDPGTRSNGLSSLDDTHWLVDPGATRLFVHLGSRVDVRDAVSGAVIGGTPVSVAPVGLAASPFISLVPDWTFERVLAFQGQPNNWMLSLVGGAGHLVGETLNRGYCRPAWRVSPHTGRGYLLYNTGGGGKYYGAILTELAAFDGATLQVANVRDITAGFGFNTDLCSGLRVNVATAPGAPRALSAAVTGRAITLSWTNVGDATAFVLEAGLAPGGRDVTIPIGAHAPVTIPNAPPGTYYLRVRGTNAFGVSRPSSEVTVVVQ